MENIKKPFLTGLFRSIKESPKLQEFILNVTDKLVSFGLSYFAIRLLSKTLSSTWNEIQSKFGGLKDAAEKASTNSTISRYLRVNTTLSTYEEDVLNGMVTPEQVQCSMDDIGGLDAIKELLFDLFQPPSDSGAEAHGSPLLTDAPTRSVLLYGPPGCGTYSTYLHLLLHFSFEG